MKLLKKQNKEGPDGKTKAIKVECRERMEYRKFMADMEAELAEFAEHDYV